jgi:hypothetical protein
MAKDFPRLEDDHRAFIARQHIFFTASSAGGAHVNLSPRSTDTFRVLGPNRVAYLDLTGSGNETSAHLRAGGRATIMFCAFEGPPLILRLYGRGRAVVRGTERYGTILAEHFDREPAGARQFIELDVELVKTSCGYGVPLFAYQDERPSLKTWSENKGEDGLAAYRQANNISSMDGLPASPFEA